MEPNNIENQIREQLNARQINPSENSWDRLDAMLTLAEEKKTKRSFGWLYIAASIVLFFSIGLFFFNSKETITNTATPVVVHQGSPVKQDANSNNLINVQNANKSQNTISPQQSMNNQSVAIQNKKSFNSINQKTTINPSASSNNGTNQAVVAQKENTLAQSEYQGVAPKSGTVATESYTHIEEKAVASVQPKKVKVNPNSLLSQVNGELNQEYRESKLDLIKRNFKTIKVALANRNDQ